MFIEELSPTEQLNLLEGYLARVQTSNINLEREIADLQRDLVLTRRRYESLRKAFGLSSLLNAALILTWAIAACLQ